MHPNTYSYMTDDGAATERMPYTCFGNHGAHMRYDKQLFEKYSPSVFMICMTNPPTARVKSCVKVTRLVVVVSPHQVQVAM